MSLTVLCTIGCVALLVGGGLMAGILYFLKRFKTRIAVIQDIPPAPIGGLQAGLHKVNGKSVALDKTIVSPLTQTECVYYHLRIEELRTSQRQTNRASTSKGQRVQSYWETVVSDKQAVACGLEDATGMVRVDLLGAEMLLRPSPAKESSFFQSCPPELQETLQRRYDFSTKGLLLSKSLRYTESIIRAGDPLFVVGEVKTKAGEPPTFVKGAQQFIVSDQAEAEVLRHYRRSIIGGYVVMGLVGLVMLLILGLAISEYSKSNASRQPAAVARKPQPAPARAEKKHLARAEQDRAVSSPRVSAQPVSAQSASANTASVPPVVAPPAGEQEVPKVQASKAAAPGSVRDRGDKAAPPGLKLPPEAVPGQPGPGKLLLPINTKVYIVSAANGRFFEADKAKNNRDGTVVVLRSKELNDSPNRLWIIKRAPDSEHFTIMHVESNRLLDAERLTSNRDGTKVQLFGTQVEGNKERLWNIQAAGEEAVHIVSAVNGRYLDADELSLNKKSTGVRLRGLEGDNKPGRKWFVVRARP